jgi:hypothetical protein
LLFDPVAELFRSRSALLRDSDDLKYEASVYLYSQHQLASLGLVRRALPSLRWSRRGSGLRVRLSVNEELQAALRLEARELREGVISGHRQQQTSSDTEPRR